jgi:hypothetical protein
MRRKESKYEEFSFLLQVIITHPYAIVTAGSIIDICITKIDSSITKR